MSEDIRKMIDKVKNFKQFVNENVDANIKPGIDFTYKQHPVSGLNEFTNNFFQFIGKIDFKK